MNKRHIICFGDSNTFGRRADFTVSSGAPSAPSRFDEDTRWPCLLQKHLGESCLVIEEGLNGRTTVFRDPLMECVAAADYLLPCRRSHQPLDLLILMLGTNDCKTRFHVNADEITLGMQLLADQAAREDIWAKEPNILIISPPLIGVGIASSPLHMYFGEGCVEKCLALAEKYKKMAKTRCYAFLNAGLYCVADEADCIHITADSHHMLAEAIAIKAKELLAF